MPLTDYARLFVISPEVLVAREKGRLLRIISGECCAVKVTCGQHEYFVFIQVRKTNDGFCCSFNALKQSENVDL